MTDETPVAMRPSGGISLLLRLCGVLLALVVNASATEYFVSPTGSNANPGTQGQPWLTLQFAANTVVAGDVVTVLPGNYKGFFLSKSGTVLAPIVIRAIDSALGPNPNVIIDQNNDTTPDRINLENASFVTIEGFTLNGTGTPSTSRALIRAVGSAATAARFVTLRRNRCDQGGRWGIFTGFVDDLLIEGNECSGAAAEHGIYVSNSGDRPVLRKNLVWGNHSSGIHMNGDLSQGGDGIISNAVVEQNILFENGNGNPTFGAPGGSAINCDGVTYSVIRNNLLRDNHKSGISLYRIDGGQVSKGNIVVNNTVHMAADARWALNIQDASTGNLVRNNILFNDHPSRGAIDIATTCLNGFLSDFNVVKDRFSIDGVFISLAQWQTQTAQDGHTSISTPLATFSDVASENYELNPSSSARDAGTATTAPINDLIEKPRPFGLGYDVGAYEFGSCRGTFSHLGPTTIGTGGVAPKVEGAGCPDIADEMILDLLPSHPTGMSFLLFGLQPAFAPTMGGVVLTVPALVQPFVGNASIFVQVPNAPILVGLAARFQIVVTDPAAVFGFAFSDALITTIG